MAKQAGNQGISSNKLARPGVRTGQSASGVTAGYSGQLGTSLGDHVTDRGAQTANRAAEPMRAAAPYKSALGNELATNVGKGGPGTGRTVYASGSQAAHGPATPAVAKPTLPKDVHGFVGPERKS
jgi:hypothetical protein